MKIFLFLFENEEIDLKDIALLTSEEFLELRNPDSKYHSENSYDVSLDDLNHNLNQIGSGKFYQFQKKFNVFQGSGGYIIKSDEEEILSVILNNTLYTTKQNFSFFKNSNKIFYSLGVKEMTIPYDKIEVVKYPEKLIAEIEQTKKSNLEKYPILLQNIEKNNKKTGEAIRFEVRMEEQQTKPNQGFSIVVMDANTGKIVAQASDEWGATLIMVAQEYRGYSLGSILGEFWYKNNPNFQSGGFTSRGEENALKIWTQHVSNFLESGKYSKLIKQGKLSKEKLNAILFDFKKIKTSIVKNKTDKKIVQKIKEEPLIYVDYPNFLLYMPSALSKETDEITEEDVVGFGFFREDSKNRDFLFKIEHDEKYRKLTTSVALQIAKDNNIKIYDGPEIYADQIDLSGIDSVKKENNFIWLEKDILPLKDLAFKESRTRKKLDLYGEKINYLIELAESKNW